MKLSPVNCEVCGKLRMAADHSKCSKIKQEQHKNDKRPKKTPNSQYFNESRMEYFTRFTGG